MSDDEPIKLDELLHQIHELLPKPVQAKEPLLDFIIIGGELGEVIVKIQGKKISVSVYTMEWKSVSKATMHGKKLATLNWKKLPASWTIQALRSLINYASQLRRESYSECQYCEETKAPEWMHDENICQDCATHYLGVIY